MASGDVLANAEIATRVGQNTITANTSTFTAETLIVSVTVNVEAGKRYKISGELRPCASAVASPSAECNIVRIREDSLTGTQVQAAQVYLATASTAGFQVVLYADYTAVATGTKTFVLTSIRQAGANTHFVTAGTTAPGVITVDYLPT
ncbi:hypothetical protein [Actinoplanes sp. NPDC051851]|uniref:hypothetical protein n=1 Tax=Actinoplanes sp. NPDC051851 TaxID=3154753 RepID=UPI003430B5DA